jgi:alpha-tubulin suppressor-like RCC1 family protein
MRSFAPFVALAIIALPACRDTPSAATRTSAPRVLPIVRRIAVDQTAPVIQIAARHDFVCALVRNGHVACWGDDAFTSRALMVNGMPPPRRTTPQPVDGVDHAVEISVGSSHGCARLDDGSVRCWRDPVASSSGTDSALRAEPAPDLGHAVALASSLAQTCALHEDGSVACSVFRPIRTIAPPPPTPALAIAVGGVHTCAVTTTRTVRCAGTPNAPALGAVAAGDELPGLTAIDEIAAGDVYSCARAGGNVWCWGANGTGQTGRPRAAGDAAVRPLDHPALPYRIPALADAVGIATGTYHACAVRASGNVMCWGDNRFGQLGAAAAMQNVEGLANVVQVALGEWSSCALTRGGEVFCWGQNQRGQLGDGTATDRPQPAPVRFGS